MKSYHWYEIFLDGVCLDEETVYLVWLQDVVSSFIVYIA